MNSRLAAERYDVIQLPFIPFSNTGGEALNNKGVVVGGIANSDGSVSLAQWSNGGLTPYNMYEGWLDPSLATGSAATGDYERLNDPAIKADLVKLASASTVADQTADLVPLEQYVATNLPVIPVETASEWFEYNSQNFVGWPTEQNPYETGQPSGTNNGPGSGTDEVVILHLKPR